MHSIPINVLVIFIALTFGPQLPTAIAKPSILQRPSLKKKKSSSTKKDDAYLLLSRSIQNRLNAPTSGSGSSSSSTPSTDYDIGAISSALRSLSKTQAALKKIDGTAHEMYQRTHKSSTSLDDERDDDTAGGKDEGSGKVGGLKVAGRMSRNAARVGCIADALFAAELCELIKLAPPSAVTNSVETVVNDEEGGVETNGVLYAEDGTLAPWRGRQVVLNTTIDSYDHYDLSISVLVIYEPDYSGGAGIGHGGVDDLLSFAKEEMAEDDDDSDVNSKNNSTETASTSSPPRGRYLVILSDHYPKQSDPTSSSDLSSIISILDAPPEQIRLSSRTGANDGASVCEPLHFMAGEVLNVIGPVVLGKHSKPSKETSDGGASDEEDGALSVDADAADNSQSLSAIHFVGYSLSGGIAAIAANILDGSLPHPKNSGNKQHHASLSSSARDRTSALCIGPPPCLSSNLPSAFVKSIINGDDIVCRTTHGTINHLCDRARRSIKGGLLGRSVGWMSEAVSLTVSGLKSKDSKGGKLTVPGNVFLVRPRRIGGGSSSIHEVGGGGREALRAALLWQLNDVLLSKSLWAHHRLDAYIRSLDRVRLKGFSDSPSNDD
mmetsp:Transcript_15172/g.27444  ORF Transcript_15172/g.27444 Transcript_15172/m.27444 type:complete len:606 (+) Transcript_15172:104-1921(+)